MVQEIRGDGSVRVEPGREIEIDAPDWLKPKSKDDDNRRNEKPGVASSCPRVRLGD